jgi:CBS-domain-containing membrane protein
MRAHQIMTFDVVTTSPEASVVHAVNTMLRRHISGLPVVDNKGKLIGIVSEGDFLRRGEINTERRRSRWLSFLVGSSGVAEDFVKEHGRKVGEVMTQRVITVNEDTSIEDIVRLMEKNHIKRVPVMRGESIVGIVTRSNLLQAIASVGGEIPTPSATDDRIRERIIRTIQESDWRPIGLEVVVKDGIVHLSGCITEESFRRAAIVAAENVDGVKLVHDHLCWIEPMSGLYMQSPEDEELSRPSSAEPSDQKQAS